MQTNRSTSKLTNKQFDQFKPELNTLIDLYKQEFSQQIPTDWQTYEKTWKNRLQTAFQEIQNTINHAAAPKDQGQAFWQTPKHQCQTENTPTLHQRPCSV